MGKHIRRQILQVAVILLLLFGALAANIIYLMTFAADGLASNALNPRNSSAGVNTLRGTILDADGRVLAQSSEDGVRRWPLGEMVAHVVGYHGERSGSVGIENYANKELLGMTDGMYRLGPAGQLLAADVGNTVKLTLDADVQQAAWEGLDGRKGAVVVMDVDTGAVLALVSCPSFDPERVEEDWDDLLVDEAAPLLNRALSGLYPPGSTIKPMILDIALRQGAAHDGEVFDCTGVLDVGGGYTIQESHNEVHGTVSLQDALIKSCNITFGTLGMRLGGKGLEDGFHRFGFDKSLDGELAEAENHLPEFASLDSGDLAQVGIGQSTLLVTPMHMAMVAAAMAHDGAVMKPYVISEIRSTNDVVLYKATPKKWLDVSSPERTRLIHSWMEDVVNEGTGTAAAINGISVAGKTGTAENSEGKDHAWFIGSADVEDRRIAFAVLVENGGEGGRVAAPIARGIVQSLMR